MTKEKKRQKNKDYYKRVSQDPERVAIRRQKRMADYYRHMADPESRERLRQRYNKYDQTKRRLHRLHKTGDASPKVYLTLAFRYVFIAAYGGTCNVCGRTKEDTGQGLCIDHDHQTGHIRGLLCHACNRALGFMRDDPTLIRALADYIERTR
jgi:hypothetical protein